MKILKENTDVVTKNMYLDTLKDIIFVSAELYNKLFNDELTEDDKEIYSNLLKAYIERIN